MTHNLVSSVEIFLGSVSSYRTKTFFGCKFPSRESLEFLFHERRQLITLKNLLTVPSPCIGPENRSSNTQDITGISHPLTKNIGVYFRLLQAFYSQFLRHITVVDVEKHEISTQADRLLPRRVTIKKLYSINCLSRPHFTWGRGQGGRPAICRSEPRITRKNPVGIG